MRKIILFLFTVLITITLVGCEMGFGGGKTDTVTIDLEEMENLEVGDEVKLEYSSSVTNDSIHFESSDPKVVTVNDEGQLRALKEGTATITISIVYNEVEYSDSITVVVNKKVVVDDEAPVFEKGNNYQEVYQLSYGKVFDPFSDLKVIDNVDGVINSKVKVESNVNNKKYGKYTVNYEATDEAGNISTFSREVNVVWDYKVKFIGHAGSYYGLMNSEEAVLYAIQELHYQAVEVDLKQTADGVFVLSHDDTFGDYTLATTTWDVLKNVEVTKTRNAGYPSQNGSVKKESYTAKLLTLERFLEICKEYNVSPVIELKSSKGITNSDQSRMQALMDLIESKGMLEKTILLGSQYNCLIWARNNGYKDIECQYLVNSLESETVLERCKEYNFTVSINVTGGYDNSDAWIFRYQSEGIKISTYTFTQYVNYPDVQKWINLGVDYLTCDWHIMDKLNLEPTPIQKYTVIFKDYDGKVLKETVVGKGGSVSAPANPSRQGYEFTGWDKALDNINSNLVINAVYKQKENAIVYVYEEGSPEEYDCSSINDFIEVFWAELYAWSGSSKDFATFKSEALAKWKSGAVYTPAKVYCQSEENKELEGYFVSCKANYDRWMPFMNEFDKQVNNINGSQTAWGSTYVGYLRLYALLQQSATYWNATRNAAIYATVTKRAVLPTQYITGEEVAIPNLVVEDGRTFLGWFDDEGNKVTSVGLNDTGTITLTARWSASIPAESFEISKPDKILMLDSYQLTWKFTPSNTTNKYLKFKSSDTSILSIDEDGVITTYRTGVVTITVEVLADSKLNQTFEVEVYYDPFIDGSYEESSIVNVSDTITLNAELFGASDAILWKSNNESIATVNNGVVTGVAVGYCEIIAYCKENPKVSFTYGITVTNPEEEEFFGIINDAHNAETHVRRNLKVAYEYLTDVYVSVSDLLFNFDYTINRDYEAKQAANSANHGGKLDSVEFITVHYTAGTAKSSDARATASYMAGTSGNSAVSIHYTTGNDGICHVLDDTLIAWHAGDGTGTKFTWTPTGVMTSENVKPTWGVVKDSNSKSGYYFTINGKSTNIAVPMTGYTSSGELKTLVDPGTKFTYFGPAWKVVDGQYYMGTTWTCFTQVYEGRISSRGGNRNSIGIESACNKGSDLWYTYQITAQLVARLVREHNLDLTRVVGHNFFSGKDCPQTLLDNNGELWEIFMEAVEAEYDLLLNMSDYTITCKSNNPDIISDNGRVLQVPRYSTTVSYTVTVTNNVTNQSKTTTYSSIIHGQYTE